MKGRAPMLFLLTGDIQIGKTRWLGRLAEHLAVCGVATAGVLAPGDWLDHGEDAPQRFEKLGINNVLLPQYQVVRFARRRDLAQREGLFDEGSQSAAAKLGWEISDAAIEQVNRHFDDLMAQQAKVLSPRLLVVDELGQLELLRDGGLTAAVRMLEAGPSKAYPHAAIIVRDWLCDAAEERFARAWGQVQRIKPNKAGWLAVCMAYGVK